MTQLAHWEREAERWAAWARTEHEQRIFGWHGDAFLELLPPPGRLTVDVGCGEGRLTRRLRERGYRVLAVDAAPTMIRLARASDPDGDYAVADASSLPVADGAADLVVFFMSLMNVDDLDGAIRDAARALARGGRLCIGILHPVAAAGTFEGEGPDAPFVIRGSYLHEGRWVMHVEREGVAFHFDDIRRPLEAYALALERAGMLIDRVRELAAPDSFVERNPAWQRWQRLPLFLDLRAVKP